MISTENFKALLELNAFGVCNSLGEKLDTKTQNPDGRPKLMNYASSGDRSGF